MCLTEIVSWGVLYYAFTVLSDTISTHEHWAHAVVTGAFSAALVVAALAGIVVGRLMQHHGPRWVMSAGSMLGVFAVLGIAAAPSLPLYCGAWLLAGLAMSATLYAPAFAAVTVWFGPHRVRALTTITLVAGLASTVFAPLTATLNAHLGWRQTYLVLAVGLAVLTIPAHLIALRPPWPHLPAAPTQALHRRRHDRLPASSPEPATRGARRDFTLLVAAFTLCTVGVYAATVNLVPLLVGRGFSTGSASLVLGIGGIGQVAGRIGYAQFERRVGLRARTAAVLGACAISTLVLALVPGPLVALIVVSLIAGGARGVFTLLQATAVSDRWGTARFAALNGIFTAPLMIGSALAPFVGAVLASALGSYQAGFLVLGFVGLAAAALSTVDRPPAQSKSY